MALTLSLPLLLLLALTGGVAAHSDYDFTCESAMFDDGWAASEGREKNTPLHSSPHLKQFYPDVSVEPDLSATKYHPTGRDHMQKLGVPVVIIPINESILMRKQEGEYESLKTILWRRHSGKAREEVGQEIINHIEQLRANGSYPSFYPTTTKQPEGREYMVDSKHRSDKHGRFNHHQQESQEFPHPIPYPVKRSEMRDSDDSSTSRPTVTTAGQRQETTASTISPKPKTNERPHQSILPDEETRVVLSACGEYLLYNDELIQINAEPYSLPPNEEFQCTWTITTSVPDMKLYLECQVFELKWCDGCEWCMEHNHLDVTAFCQEGVGKSTRYIETDSVYGIESEGKLILNLTAQSESMYPQVLCTVRAGRDYEPMPSPSCELECGTEDSSPGTFGRIVNGQDTLEGEFPYSGALIENFHDGMDEECSFLCSVTLIHPNWVLTSAYCYYEAYVSLGYVYVLLGAWDFLQNNPDVQRRSIDWYSSMVHPAFDYSPLAFDIALMRMWVPAIYTPEVQPACLPKLGANYEVQDMFVTGWGMTEDDTLSSKKQIAYQQTWKWTECRSRYGRYLHLSMICASAFDEGPCHYDTGAGLMYKDPLGRWVVVGVTSWGPACATPGLPNVYSNVEKSLSWILRTIQCEGADRNPVSPIPKKPHTCGIANSRIVGGTEAKVNEFPWQAGLALKYHEHPYCGATIISRKFVLTTASCLYFTPQPNLLVDVLVGYHDVYDMSRNPDAKRYPICNWLIHPDYNWYWILNDIAILEVAEPILFDDTVSPVCLPSNPANLYVGEMATVAGWGSLDYYMDVYPDTLQKVTVQIISNNECTSMYYFFGILPYEICAYIPEVGGKDSCLGDGGGALIVLSEGVYEAVGLVSWGIGCGSPYYPGVYIRITSYLNWILSNTYGTNLH